jgi:uncharacterized integral membrane protein (TIGR00698 family)
VTSEKKTNSAQGNHWLYHLIGLVIVALLSWLAWWITKQVYSSKDLFLGIPGKALEYPLWGALAGLLGNLLLKLTGVHHKVRAGFRTELFLKVGLVLMGAGINLALLGSAAAGSIIQALVMITSVFFFTYWLAGKFGLDDKLRAVMSTALSVCGVSAAIAAAGSVLAKKEHVTFVTTLVIVVALPMMLLMPIVANWIGLPETIAGAWFGGNIDTTAAVVGAGTIYGETAQKVATIVKTTQNALIGVVAFILAVVFSFKSSGKRKTKPSVRIIWERFPKFVLGFVAASILFSLNLIDGGKGTAIEAIKNWAFLLAFVCMGLELSISEFKQMGWKPVVVFLISTVFNTLLALGIATILFTYLFPLSNL